MIEHGLTDCSQYRPRKSVSEDVGQHYVPPPSDGYVSLSSVEDGSLRKDEDSQTLSGCEDGGTSKIDVPLSQTEDNVSETQASKDVGHHLKPPSRTSPESSESDWETLDSSILEDPCSKEGETTAVGRQTEIFPKESAVSDSIPITVQPQANTGHTVFVPGLISGLEEDQYGMPLAVFTKVIPSINLQTSHRRDKPPSSKGDDQFSVRCL